MKKRLLFPLGLLLALSSTVVAQGKVTLRFAHWDLNAGIAETVKEWNRQHPEIQIKFEGLSYDKLAVMIASGTAPDMFSEGEWVGFTKMASSGVLRDLTPYFKSQLKMDAFFKQAIDGSTVNGKIYGMSTGFSHRGFVGYNKDLFNKAGLRMPTKDWDWNDFLELAKKLNKDSNGDGKLDQWGFGVSNLWQDIVRTAGGSMFNEKRTKLTIDTPQATKALQWWADLALKYKMTPTGGEVNAYQKGQVGMLQSHPQGLVLFTSSAKPKFDAGTIVFPKDPVSGLRRFAFDGNMISIAANSKHPKECWEFLKWFNTADASPRFFRKAMGTLQLVPPLKSVARSAAYLEPDRSKLPPSFDMEVFVDGVDECTVPDEIVRYRTDVDNALSTQWSGVLSGRYSVQQFIERTTREVNSILARK